MKKNIIFISTMAFCLCFNALYSQSFDNYVLNASQNNFVLVASSSNSLSSPVDVDFYPIQSQRPMELWILNQGTSSSGGSTVIVSNANKTTRTRKYVKDGNAWHFMSMASALAFGDSLWATSADILDANHKTGQYTGPTLWPSDLTIYGIVGNPSSTSVNGSHLDMIHQSPYGKGIAFETDLAYWVLDGYEGNLKRYDYVATHQPGGSDHSAGLVYVYPEFSFTKHATLPSHIVIDKNKKYLYGCDPVGKQIFRVDITSGTKSGNGTKINNEPLAGYYEYSGLKFDNIINTALKSPVGIDVYNDRLIVTDNGGAEIIIYDISNNFKEVGRIKLSYVTTPDIMGIKVGPDGRIYFADKANKRVYMIDNSTVPTVGIDEITNTNSISIYPNPTTSTIIISAEKLFSQIEITDVLGKIVYTETATAKTKTVDVSNLPNGLYFVKVKSGNAISTQKILKQ